MEVPLSPLAQYRADLKKKDFVYDAAQERTVIALQALYDRLCVSDKASAWAIMQKRVTALFGKKADTPIKGLYLWGGVGRGKTYLMDTFFASLPFERKMRIHFHRFMRRVHDELHELDGYSDPLVIVAANIAKQARVLCFDEFFVSDITDAMLLAGLLKALFERGVVLVATSNLAPENLYKDGLQRVRFLPAIELLERHTEVLNVDGDTDYRLRTLEQASLFHAPLNETSAQAMLDCYSSLVHPGVAVDTAPQCPQHLQIAGRDIPVVCASDSVVWFRFSDICGGPRSQRDYIDIASEFNAVLVEGVPQFDETNSDSARRFLNMVDEFYDRRVKLILSASSELAELYRGGPLQFEFARVLSRLMEMQSVEYLSQAHHAS